MHFAKSQLRYFRRGEEETKNRKGEKNNKFSFLYVGHDDVRVH